VALLNTALGRFFAISIAIHILAFFIIRMPRLSQTAQPDPIAVSLLPQSERPSAPAGRAPNAAPTPRPLKAPAIIAKNNPTVAKEIKETTTPLRDWANPVEKPRQEPAQREPIQETTVVTERPLPTLRELLPSATYSSANARNSGPVSLNTRDPIYVSYFTKIKQNIEQQWEYPEMALRYGLQGRLSLEFTIGSSGQLEQLRMIRSSGSQLLDEEALRAIKAAAPFPPIPSWIRPIPLPISASMEYHDNRLNDRVTR
jgi:protein TonB